jgi:tRNA modification GTPase
MYVRDTIAAISTPVGEGGVGIVRVSGDRAKEIAERIFVRKESGGMKSHRFYYGEIKDPEDGSILDEAMVVLMQAPRSYTREDVLEIQCHGGYILVRKILELVLRQGARLAEPGEFTKRAFLNGRIDLVQAEAVIDVIRGKTEAAVALAQHQREGLLSRKIQQTKEDIVHSLALIEAYLDFPEEDIEFAENREIVDHIKNSLEKTEKLIDGFNEGRVLREGVSVLIAGKPNVGKSSLLNTLLREKRAIVTSVPGTTRDIIEEVVNINGLPVKMLDTAGIRLTEDIVELEGVKLALERIALADLVLLVLDISRPLDEEDTLIIDAVTGSNVIVVMNKSDLTSVIELPESLEDKPKVEISTLNGEGINALREMIFETFVRDKAIDGREFVVLSQARHRDALLKTRECLNTFLKNFSAGMNLEIVALDLRAALDALGEITGETTPDDILDYIFERFCIGK